MPPVASFTADPPNPDVGEGVAFTSEGGGDPVEWLWSFGDGGSSTEENPTHAYTAPGVYNVTLTVVDADGASDTAVAMRGVTVSAAETDPLNPAPVPLEEVWNYSTNGCRYAFLLKYKESFARDANLTTAWIECDWVDTNILKNDLLGYTEYVAGDPYLHRHVPLAVPWSGPGGKNKQYLQRMDLDQFYPAAPDRDHVYPDPANDNWPYVGEDGRATYQLAFSTVPYDVKTDDEVDRSSPTTNPPELQRYVRVTKRYLPESRKIPSAGFECYDPAASFAPFVIQEVGSIPTFQVEIIVECIQWPEAAFPESSVNAALGTVNDRAVTIRGREYAAGTLLYKGLAGEVTPYDDASGRKMLDIPHLFGFRPTKWNYHRRNDGSWFPIVVKGTTPSGDNTLKPQFPLSNHNDLFTPAGLS